jgi:hypothetical protein
MAPSKKVSIITLGCPKNTSDTSNLARLLRARGHEVVLDAAEADAIVVHTCSFIEAAKKESIHTILQAGQLKTEGKKLIVTGCLVQQHGEEIFKELPEVDAFLGTGQLAQVADLLEKPRGRFMDRANPGGYLDPDQPSAVRGERLAEDKRPAANRQPPTANGPTAVLRLSEGCSHPCSFCVIPRLRGPVQSRSAETILREARELAAQGIEEFSVIAQDTGDWGRDFRLSSSPATTGGGPIIVVIASAAKQSVSRAGSGSALRRPAGFPPDVSRTLRRLAAQLRATQGSELGLPISQPYSLNPRDRLRTLPPPSRSNGKMIIRWTRLICNRVRPTSGAS